MRTRALNGDSVCSARVSMSRDYEMGFHAYLVSRGDSRRALVWQMCGMGKTRMLCGSIDTPWLGRSCLCSEGVAAGYDQEG